MNSLPYKGEHMRETKHSSHETRFSDSSLYDEKCIHCGATDEVPGGWGRLAHPCPVDRKADTK
jgi:hypothetical protein